MTHPPGHATVRPARRTQPLPAAQAPSLAVEAGLAEPAADLGRILAQLRAHGGQGFERYKPGTVRRRVERRMGLQRLHSIAAYADLLQHDADERERLFQELLIGVTGFFRDPLTWDALARQVLPALAAAPPDAPADAPVRAWCAGCSTGEEPYSLAISWLDAQAAGQVRRPLQVFATDLHAGALARARRGVYGIDRLHGVSEQRRARCFDRVGDQARVVRAVREMVLFARHDLTADPPFGRLDLLMCRNVLVYLQAAQQRALIELFHHCLRPGGWLVLGHAETVGPAGSLFQPLDGHPRLYRRHAGPPARRALCALDTQRMAAAARKSPSMTHSDPRQDTLPRRAERLVLDRFAPASILVNRDGDVLWTCGPTARYLEAADGRANVNVLAQARASLRVWLASALREVQAAGSRGVELRGLRLVEAGPEVVVDVRVLPLDDAADAPGTSLVVISEPSPAGPGGSHADAAPGATPATPADPAARLPALRQTVRRLREQLQAATESHQAAHEELQSSNEELITSREEMQSMNEELQAINAELQAKLDALALAQSDMKNLLDSTQIATLFLDSALNLRRFTAQARTVINLRDGDAGRPLSDLTTRLDDPGLVDRAAQVLRTLVPSEQEVSGTGGGWYSVRILPYRTVDDVVDGVVITITDIARPDASQRPRPTGPDR